MSSRNAVETSEWQSGEAAPDCLKRLRQLNRLFWLCWLGVPASIAIAVWEIAFSIPAAVDASPQGGRCLRLLGNPNYISTDGKVLWWSLFLFDCSIFFAVLFVLHRMVRKFVSGRIFVSDTLAGLKTLGVMLLAWPFLEAAVRAGVFAALKALHDLPSGWPLPMSVDFGVVAMGFFLLALKVVVEHAIYIKSDHELTI